LNRARSEDVPDGSRPADHPPVDRFRARLAIRRDEVAGLWPGMAFAAGLGGVSGVTIVTVFAAWTWAMRSSGAEAGGAGLLAATGWWAVLWFALSGALLGALWAAYRAWDVAARIHRRRVRAREERLAVASAEAILAAVAVTRDPSDGR
jgi:hypothetical protein